MLACHPAFNADRGLDAFLVQIPAPRRASTKKRPSSRSIPTRTSTGCTRVNLGRLVDGRARARSRARPPASRRCSSTHEVPDRRPPRRDRRARGLTIGRPLAFLLALKRPHANAAVTVVHTGVADLAGLHPPGRHPGGRGRRARADHARHGEAGRRGRRRRDHDGTASASSSDVVDEVAEVAGWMTPRLGGVGPMTRRDAPAQLCAGCHTPPSDRLTPDTLT